MSNTSQLTSYTKLKQGTDHDTRNVGPLVSAFDAQTSTLNQTVISFTQLTCDLDRKSNVMVFVDGNLLREGTGNDYIWNAGVGNTSSSITLAAPISAGLNIQAYKIGIAKGNVANAETIQASVNLTQADVDQKNVNRIINGSMQFAQRGATFAAVGVAAYTLDRWQYAKSGAMVHTVSQSTNVPANAFSPNSLLIDCTTLDNAIAATDFTVLLQIIEGNMLRPFKGKNMVLGFKVYATKTGTYCIGLQNGGSTRSLVKEYTVTASNTWQQVYIRFQHDSSGTWAYDNTAGLRVEWVLAAGTNYQTTPDTWQNGNFVATANQVNACDSVVNDFAITDVVLVEDNASLNKIPDYTYAGRDFLAELALCQRYYEKSYNYDVAIGTVTDVSATYIYNNSGTTFTLFPQVPFVQPKRVNPSVAIYNPSTGASGSWQATSPVETYTATLLSAFTKHMILQITSVVGGRLVRGHFTADAEL